MSIANVRTLQSIDRAVAILELLADEPEGLGLGEMAGRLKLKPQTLQGLVRSLQAHDLVVQVRRGGQYVLGPGVHALSRRWLDRCDRATLARDVVAGLAQRTGESVLLSELRQGRLFALVEAAARQVLTVSQNAMHDSPLHLMATGKVLLAYLPQSARDELIAGLDMTPRTPRTVTSRDELRDDLLRVREVGYAVTDEQAVVGVVAVAVPVRDGSGQVTASLGLAMPRARYEQERLDDIAGQLIEAAGEVAARWGG